MMVADLRLHDSLKGIGCGISELTMRWLKQNLRSATPSVVILNDGLLQLEIFLLVDDALLTGFL